MVSKFVISGIVMSVLVMRASPKLRVSRNCFEKLASTLIILTIKDYLA